jgi:hypothetical protein
MLRIHLHRPLFSRREHQLRILNNYVYFVCCLPWIKLKYFIHAWSKKCTLNYTCPVLPTTTGFGQFCNHLQCVQHKYQEYNRSCVWRNPPRCGTPSYRLKVHSGCNCGLVYFIVHNFYCTPDIYTVHLEEVGRNTSVGIATCYGWTSRGSNPCWPRFLAAVQTGPGAGAASDMMVIGSLSRM